MKEGEVSRRHGGRWARSTPGQGSSRGGGSHRLCQACQFCPQRRARPSVAGVRWARLQGACGGSVRWARACTCRGGANAWPSSSEMCVQRAWGGGKSGVCVGLLFAAAQTGGSLKSLPCTSISRADSEGGGTGGSTGGYETSLPSQDNSRTAVGGTREINNAWGDGRAGRMA